MKGQINHQERGDMGKDKSYEQFKQMSLWPTPAVWELLWLAQVDHLDLGWVWGTTCALRTGKTRHREINWSSQDLWGSQTPCPLSRQSSHRKLMPELETIQRHPKCSSSDTAIYFILFLSNISETFIQKKTLFLSFCCTFSREKEVCIKMHYRY